MHAPTDRGPRTGPQDDRRSGTGSADHPISPPGEMQRAVWTRLAADWVFWLGVVSLGLVSLPYLFPILSEDNQWWLDNVWANLILYGIAVLSVRVGVGRVESRAERRFWFFLGWSLVAVLTVYVAWGLKEYIAPWQPEWTWMELFSQACYLTFYLLVAFALDANRTVQEESVDQELRWLRGAGLGVLLAGFLAYFAVAPVLIYRTDPVAWIPILLIYASLDLLICLEALRVRAKTRDRRWRGILGWVGLTFGAFAVMDFSEAADYAEWFDQDYLILFGELQWFIPIAILLVGARVQLTSKREVPETANVGPVRSTGGALVAYAVALPLLHLVLTSLDVLNPEIQGLRGVIVLCVMVLVGIMAFGYERKVIRLREMTRNELEESKERYSSFVETSVEGIWLVEFDPPIPIDQPARVQAAAIFRNGRIVECNDTMARMYALPDAAAMTGMTMRDLFGPVKDSGANARATIQFVSSGYRTVRETLEFMRPDGTLNYFEGSVVGAIEDDHLVRVWATQVDVTPRVEAMREKDRLEDQLRRSQRLETIGTLAGGIAHDFNNILAPILGFAELAEDSLPAEEEEIRDSIRQIRTAANRGKGLVGQILAVGQKTKDVRRPVSVGAVVMEAKRLLEQSLPATVKFEMNLEDPCPPALVDPAQVHQVVMNLCTNSGQAMVDQRGTIRLEVRSTTVDETPTGWDAEPGSFVVLSVSDDGIGMPEEIRNRAFEPFFKGEEFAPGSGLGLSVTHGIVSGYSGFIEIQSDPGQGTTIQVFLPATEETAEGLGGVRDSETLTQNWKPSNSDEGHLRILLVDDEEGVVQTSARMLRRMGHSVVSLTDSTQALSILDSEQDVFDVLVTDHTMPDVTGPQLAAAATERYPTIGIVIASGHRFGDQNDSGSSIVQLEKPFTMAELQASVETARSLASPEANSRL